MSTGIQNMKNTKQMDCCVGCNSKDNVFVILDVVGWCRHCGTIYWHDDGNREKAFYAKIPYNAPNRNEKPPIDKMEA